MMSLRIGPPIQDLAGKLAAVIDLDRGWSTALRNEARHRCRDVLDTQRLVNHDIDAFMGVVINDGQRPKAPTVKERVAHEIHPPEIIGREGLLSRLASSAASTASRPAVPQR